MSKEIIWMQGFDHLQVYGATGNVVFNNYLDRMALLDPRIVVVNNTRGSSIGAVDIRGVAYQGIHFGTGGDTDDNAFSQTFSFSSADADGGRIYAGCRITMADCNPGAVYATVGGDTDNIITLKTASVAGAFTVFVEFCYDFAAGKIYLFADGDEVGASDFITDAPALKLHDGSGNNPAVVSGVGAVYSDYYFATQASVSAAPVPLGSIRVKSATVDTFSGDSDFYNTLGLDIVDDLNSVNDDGYNDVGGYLHIPSTTGVLRYAPTPEAGGVLAIQATGKIVAPAKDYSLSQDIYTGDNLWRSKQREFSRLPGGYIAHNSVFNFPGIVSADELSAINVRIKSAKPDSGDGGDVLPQIDTPVNAWYQPVNAVFELPVTIYDGFIDDFTFKKLSATEHCSAKLIRMNDTQATLIFTRNNDEVSGNEAEYWQLSNTEGVTALLTVWMTMKPREFIIKDVSASGKKVSFTFSGEYYQATTWYQMADVLNITLTGILDADGNGIDTPLATRASVPVGYFGELHMSQHNADILKYNIDVFLLDDFTGTAELRITGRYSGISTSQTIVI